MRGRPVDRLGDVVGGHRLHARVDVVRLALVTGEPDQGELRVRHAGLDAGDAHAGAVQVAAEVEAELVHERLRAAVHVPARVGVGARHRAEVDHVAAAAGRPCRAGSRGCSRPGPCSWCRSSGPSRRGRRPGRGPGRARGRRCSRARRLRELLRQAGDRGGDRRPVPDVELQREDAGPNSAARSLSRSVRRAAATTRAPVRGESAGDRGAEAAARAGDEDGSWLGACHHGIMPVSPELVSTGLAIARASAPRGPAWRCTRPRSAWSRWRSAR